MTRNLRALREHLQIRKRQFERIGDEPLDAQTPIGEIVFTQSRIFLAVRHSCAIDLEDWRNIRKTEFSRKRVATAEQALDAIGQPLGRGKKLLEIWRLRETVAACEQQTAGTSRAQSEEPAPMNAEPMHDCHREK